MTDREIYQKLEKLLVMHKSTDPMNRYLLEPFIAEEIRHIRAMRMIERGETVLKLLILGAVIYFCLTTFLRFVNL